jgi:hypothetical protein
MPDVRASVRLQSPAHLLIWRQAYSGARYRGTTWLSSMAGTDRPSRRVSLRIVKLSSCARATHAGFKALVPLRFFVSIYDALGDSLAECALALS